MLTSPRHWGDRAQSHRWGRTPCQRRTLYNKGCGHMGGPLIQPICHGAQKQEGERGLCESGIRLDRMARHDSQAAPCPGRCMAPPLCSSWASSSHPPHSAVASTFAVHHRPSPSSSTIPPVCVLASHSWDRQRWVHPSLWNQDAVLGILSLPVLFYWGCCNKVPQTG